MGRMVLGAFGMYWWIDDPEDEVLIEPYQSERLAAEDASWWKEWPSEPGSPDVGEEKRD
jgi:hypothetical protein